MKQYSPLGDGRHLVHFPQLHLPPVPLGATDRLFIVERLAAVESLPPPPLVGDEVEEPGLD